MVIRGGASSSRSGSRTKPLLWAIPQYHIVCTSTLPTRDPDVMAKARGEGRLWEVDTGHDLMITEPVAVADALMEVAAHRDQVDAP